MNNITLNNLTLNLILQKLNHKKITRHKNKKIFRIDKILSVTTKQCKYIGDKNNTNNKTHLEIKFTSPDEKGKICLSILLEQYHDLI